MKKLVKILEESEDKTRVRMTHQIEDEDSAFATTVKSKVILFDELLNVGDDCLKSIIAQVPHRPMAMALQDLQDWKVKVFIALMTKPYKIRFDDEIEALGPLSEAMVAAAKRRVVKTARELESFGQINLGRFTVRDGDEEPFL